MAKSRDAFRTISEVAEWLDTPAHVLRFWESKFTQVKPVKRAGGRRYYRPADIELLSGIKTLLHEQGMTIKGAQRLLRQEGVKYVSSLGRQLDDYPIEEPVEEVASETVDKLPAVDTAKSEITQDKPKETAAEIVALDAVDPAKTSTSEETSEEPEAANSEVVPEKEREEVDLAELIDKLRDEEPTISRSPSPEEEAHKVPDYQFDLFSYPSNNVVNINSARRATKSSAVLDGIPEDPSDDDFAPPARFFRAYRATSVKGIKRKAKQLGPIIDRLEAIHRRMTEN